MTIITTEIQKWKRNKIVWCILALTLLLGAFAIERACSISRSSPFMDSFGDLYTLAFKNLSSLFLPIVLGMFATTLFFDEHKNDTMKELLIIPITKAQLYFSKVAVVILMSVGLCLITFLLCVVGGLIAGGFPDLNAQTLMDAGLLYLAGGILIPIAMLPIVFLSTLSKGYTVTMGAAHPTCIPCSKAAEKRSPPPREDCAHLMDPGEVRDGPPRRTHSIGDLIQRNRTSKKAWSL